MLNLDPEVASLDERLWYTYFMECRWITWVSQSKMILCTCSSHVLHYSKKFYFNIYPLSHFIKIWELSSPPPSSITHLPSKVGYYAMEQYNRWLTKLNALVMMTCRLQSWVLTDTVSLSTNFGVFYKYYSKGKSISPLIDLLRNLLWPFYLIIQSNHLNDFILLMKSLSAFTSFKVPTLSFSNYIKSHFVTLCLT